MVYSGPPVGSLETPSLTLQYFRTLLCHELIDLEKELGQSILLYERLHPDSAFYPSKYEGRLLWSCLHQGASLPGH